MSFRQKLKFVDSLSYEIVDLSLHDICSQYNPDRFNSWKKTCVGVVDDQFLHIKYSPHVHFLKLYEDNRDRVREKLSSTPYYKMHKNYGKSDAWIRSKIKSFINIYEDIKIYGIKETPIILTSPIIKNQYNQSYEIFEGHHRCAISYFLNHPTIKCRLKTV